MTDFQRSTHMYSEELTTKNLEYCREVEKFTFAELERDLADCGDITTEMIVDESCEVAAEIRAQESGILAGIQELKFFLCDGARSHKFFPSLKVEFCKFDGDLVGDGDLILKIGGKAWEVLKAERVALNLLQRMSGVASMTQSFVKKIENEGLETLIVPTRKTLWGWLDKRAVVVGGGGTHRLSLADAILIKDTHLKIGRLNLLEMIQAAFAIERKVKFVEVEVESVEDARVIFEIICDLSPSVPAVLMFDNMASEDIRALVNEFRSKSVQFEIVFEASGGINEMNFLEYAKANVDVLSMGGITMAAPALSFHLKIVS